jgi:chromosome segregation protein
VIKIAYIKKLTVHGFKSFPRKTEIPFTSGINVILGPNGSGKSNISDALCFVLGRLSIKSMRAAKSQNLIFMGTKAASPAKEAIVEIVFDNEDKTFSIDSPEISLKRVVRKNGQSIYKINNETKTRQEIIGLLAQAGIDPNGFNIILQGEIQNFVKMHTEERRKIIEEVSGISVYESRKEKSLKELDRTEEKLKEVLSILRERTTFLNNLEKERQQALRFQKLQEDLKKFKASIIYFDLTKKKKSSELIDEDISKKNKEIDKIKKAITDIESITKNLEEKINKINSKIQEATGLEQEKLNQEIANVRAERAGMSVRIDNYENKLSNLIKQKSELEELIRKDELEIKELNKASPTVEKKEKEMQSKKQELEKLEEQRKKFYMIKSELKSIRDRFEDKKSLLQNYKNESDFLLKQMESLSRDLFDRKTTQEIVDNLKISLAQKKQLLENLNKKERELEKISFANESEIEKQKKLIEKISKMDICPLCKSKITEKHIHSINDEINPLISSLKQEIENSDRELSNVYNTREIVKQEIEKISFEISKREGDIVKLSNIEEKKEQIKMLQEKIDISKGELFGLEKIKANLEKNFEENSNIEQKYETFAIEVQEISIRTKENVTSEISFKQRELERSKISIKQTIRDISDITEELNSLKKQFQEREKYLENKRKQEEELTRKFQEMIKDRDSCNIKTRENEQQLLIKKNLIHNIEQEINNFKVDKAKVNAEIQNFETELLEFANVEIIKTNRESLIERLGKIQESLSTIGSVNMRSLEVYDEIKQEYDSIKEKTEIIEKEKQGILKIINEIDIKKRKTFMKTFSELNELFSRNFAQISTKGQVFLEIENKHDPFEGGVGIVVKTGHGKYFDVTSLSGGEQTMVALSLIFAIQELSPYCFYILDEIDAALDKRNSERLALLLKKFMQKGQYIVITHNDEVITRATNLYGVSMHEGISKITSLKI